MAAWPCHSRPTFAGRCPSGCHLATPPKRGPRGGPPERVPAPRGAAHVAAVPHGGVPVGRRRRGGLPPSRGGALGLRRLRRGTAGDHGGQEEPVRCPFQGASAAGPPRSGDQEAMDPGHPRGANPARPRLLCQRGADEPGRRRGAAQGARFDGVSPSLRGPGEEVGLAARRGCCAGSSSSGSPATSLRRPSSRRQFAGCSSPLAWRSRRSTSSPTPVATSSPVSISASSANGWSSRSRGGRFSSGALRGASGHSPSSTGSTTWSGATL